ncbi:MAG: S41 family peptidase [Bacteroidales bacterium]|nr:S41 family peptidase [Bacteroidales bacterium]
MTISRSKKVLLSVAIVITVATTAGFILVNQESRDFRFTKSIDIYISLMRELNAFYVDEIDAEKIVNKGIEAMLSSLDPYTVFYPEEDSGDLDFITTGKYGGFGSLIRKSGDYIVVTNVYKGFPADQNGIKPGDEMISIDGTSLKGVSSEKASDMLKGEPGTEAELVFRRNGTEFTKKLKRERISIPAVPYYGMIDSRTGYIRFTNFTQNCIAEVRSALIDLKEKQGAESLVLDLRNNPGGLVNEAVEIVNLFVKPGLEVVSTRGRAKQYDAVFRTNRNPVAPDMPVVVLINRGSASASEIVAGALQDFDRAIIVGERSFGKGLVQVARPLSYKAQVKITTAKYYIPSGRCIQAVDFSNPNEDGSVGVIPDSLIKTFSTGNGRPVKDGGGIIPDIVISTDMLTRFTSELYVQNMIFDYATEYFWTHPQPAVLDSLRLSDNDLARFKAFLVEKNFSYQTSSESALEELIATAREEKLYDDNSQALEQLRDLLSHSLDRDVAGQKAEMTELIESELAGRYFYDAGMIKYSLSRDSQVREAIKISADRDRYNSLLEGPAI